MGLGPLDTMTIGLTKEVASEGIRIKSSIPLQRGGQAEEVAQAILWLLSEKSAYTTGSFIDVTGGI